MATMVMQIHFNVMLHLHCLSRFPIANYNRYHSKWYPKATVNSMQPTDIQQQHKNTFKYSRTDTSILCGSDIRGQQLFIYACVC